MTALHVNIPAGFSWNQPTRQGTIRFPTAESLKTYLEAHASVENRADIFEIYQLNGLEQLHGHNRPVPRIRLALTETDLLALHRNRHLLSRLPVSLVYRQPVEVVNRDLHLLLSFNKPVELDNDILVDPDVTSLLNLTEKLLLSPLVKSTVLPLYQLLQEVFNQNRLSRCTLWELSNEKLGRDYFVTDDGLVSLSGRWANQRKYFGDLSDSIESLQSSDLAMELSEYKQYLFIHHLECATCPAFRYCEGYLRVLDMETDCSPFLKLMAYLENHAEGIRECYSALSDTEKGQISRMMESTVTPPSKIPQRRETKPEMPQEATVFISDRCTNNCIFCAPADKRKAGSEPDREQILRFIKKCGQQRISTLTFSGAGEPTMNSSLVEFVELARKSGIQKTVIFTNGSQLDESLVKRLETAGNDCFMVSIHGMQDTHDVIAGRKGSFQMAVRALDLIAKSRMKLTVNSCLVRSNAHQLNDMLELSRQSQCATHSLSFPEWSGNALENIDKLISYEAAGVATMDIDFSRYQHLSFDNFPHCVVPPEIHLPAYNQSILYKESSVEEVYSRRMNLGHNTYTQHCMRPVCRYQGVCCGVDRVYLQERGDKEFLGRAVSDEGHK